MGYLDGNGLSRVWSKIKAFATNAASKVPYGELDGTSTSTVMTANVPGITELVDGTCCYLRNNVVTSAENFTININNLGAKPVYTNLAAATAETTKFNVNYTMLFIYNENRVSGGCWDCYNGYDSNTNTIGYQIRTNSSTRPASDKFYRYRMLFTSADGTKWVPANTSTSTNATASRSVNQRPIDPWGDIVYYSSTTAVDANASVGTGSIWQQYTFAFGYSFNRTGAALVLPYPSPIYIKCTPQSNGSAIIDPDTPYVTSLPSTEDGKIYIYIGRSYSATNIELVIDHPVYYYKDNAIRIWTNPASTGGGGAVTSVNGQTGAVVLDADDVGALPDSTTIPTKTSDLVNDSGYITSAPVASVNGQTGTVVLDADDVGALPDSTVIPTKTSDLNNDSGFLTSAVTSFNGSTGAVTYTAPVTSVNTKTGAVSLTASDVGALPDSTVIPSAATATPLVDGTAAIGSSSKYAKEDHVHPTDTSRQEALVSGTNIKTVNGTSLLGSGDVSVGVTSFNGNTGAVTYSAPVSSVNGQTGAVSISIPQPITDYYPVSGNAPSQTLDGASSTGLYDYSSTYSQIPASSGGTVIVTENGNYIKQIAFSNSTDGVPVLHLRTTDNNSVWGNWYRVALRSDLPGISVDVAELTATNTSVATIGGLACRRYGKVVTLVGYITAVNLTTTLTTVTTLPVGYRPTNAVAMSVYSTTTNLATSVGIVNTNGTVQVRLSASRTSGNIYIHAAWVLAA